MVSTGSFHMEAGQGQIFEYVRPGYSETWGRLPGLPTLRKTPGGAGRELLADYEQKPDNWFR